MCQFYNVIMVMLVKNESLKGILKLVLSIVIYIFIDNYLFDVLDKIGIHFTGDLGNYLRSARWLLICAFLFVIYRGEILASKSRYNKSPIVNVIFCIGAFVMLVFATYLCNKIVVGIDKAYVYTFTNFLEEKFSINHLIGTAIDVIARPFVVTVIFVLGVSNIIKKTGVASLISGVLYILYMVFAVGYNCSIDRAIMITLVPSITIMLLTYLYKTTNNIWLVYISYALYILLGVQVLRYFVW